MGVTFKVQHRVHHVLQHARPGQRALFGDVSDQHDGRATGLGCAREVGGTLAHLGDRARGAGELFGIDSLDGVDDGDIRTVGV